MRKELREQLTMLKLYELRLVTAEAECEAYEEFLEAYLDDLPTYVKPNVLNYAKQLRSDLEELREIPSKN